jgi:hypothetical protein
MGTQTKSPAGKRVRKTTMDAYTDCWAWGKPGYTEERCYAERNLQYRAEAPVPKEAAIEIMGAAVPGGYNEFTADLLGHLPDGCEVTLARAGSVCVYVGGRLPAELEQTMKADEFSYDPETNLTCIWWD